MPSSCVSETSKCSSFFQEYLKTHDQLPLVSICTPTYNRRLFIPAAIQCFQNQTYPADRMEWIVVDDGTDKVRDIFETANVPQVHYYEYADKMTLGTKRNLVHSLSHGEILVYMDDDDWYPRDRVAHAVQKLLTSDALCAGSSELYLYDNINSQMYQFGPYGPNHATAGTFAFKRELLNITAYDTKSSVAEEPFFLKNHTIPLVQLDPLHTILVFTHDHNTIDKRLLLKCNDNNELINPSVKRSDKPLQFFFPYPEEQPMLAFYLSLKDVLKDYDAGLVKHKPDVVKQVDDIMANRQLSTPVVQLQIGGKPTMCSINQLLIIIRTLQEQNTKLATSLQERDSMAPVADSISIQIPGTEKTWYMTVPQINRVIANQHERIMKMTHQLSVQMQIQPELLYLINDTST